MKRYSWVFIPALLLSLVGSQFLYDQISREFKSDLKLARLNFSEPLIPSHTALKILSFGNTSLTADLLWLQIIQYFGGGNPNGSYPALGPILHTVSELDPKFEEPFAFGLVVLPFMKQIDSAINLGEKARISQPNNGLLTYYLATDYHLYKKDYRKAAELYQIAANLPDSPTAAKRLAGVTLAQLSDSNSDRLAALEFWSTVYEETPDPEEKERAALWFSHMQIVYSLEQLNQTYKEQVGVFPKSQEELITRRLLGKKISSPIGRELEFNTETGRITFERLAP